MSRILQISEFLWTQRSLVEVVLKNFLLIDAAERSKICCDRKRLFFAVSLYPLSFFANTPLCSSQLIPFNHSLIADKITRSNPLFSY